MSASAPVRLAHFSDLHLTTTLLGWRAADWLNKRLTGWLSSHLMPRGQRFRDAGTVVEALWRDLEARRPDHLIFSGDATMLGFESEMRCAAGLLHVSDGQIPGLAVPGNHDYYTRAAAASGLFERYFARWQEGVRVDEAVYPFAQRAGPVWLIGVNTCRGNRLIWDASGFIDRAQLDRLTLLLKRLDPGPRVIVTHYPICLAGGGLEKRHRRLRNLGDLVAVAAAGGVKAWLHGHRHDSYSVAESALAPFPVICAGSATEAGHWSYTEYVIAGDTLRGQRRVYDGRGFRDGESFTLSPGKSARAAASTTNQ
jgi:3',5'-cyclic AMP phosphodiesterase CpdA